jgi:hypothetical protein
MEEMVTTVQIPSWLQGKSRVVAALEEGRESLSWVLENHMAVQELSEVEQARLGFLAGYLEKHLAGTLDEDLSQQAFFWGIAFAIIAESGKAGVTAVNLLGRLGFGRAWSW